jgi:hypothetical protein
MMMNKKTQECVFFIGIIFIMKRLLLYYVFINLFCFGLCFIIVSSSLLVYGWELDKFFLYIIKNIRFYFFMIGLLGLIFMQIKR